MTRDALTGDELLNILSALANPHRLRLVAALARGRKYVSQLAREVGISRPLVQIHLRKLQSAGLVTSHLELSEEGKAVNYYELEPLHLELTADLIADAAKTLTMGTECEDVQGSAGTREPGGDKR